ncbi:glycosyltransferase family 4 protein [Neptuniibacter sp. QD37_6]|uniref:glycosyltransferase family 4 protein n=1 Tax=Neptuniibacter sp. QD37_6 TaxID=3398210 RepID=UPI0039F58D6D
MNQSESKSVAILCLSPGIGGLELYAYREYQALSRIGIKCFVVVSKASRLAKIFKDAGVEVYELNVSFRRLPVLSAYRLANYLRSNEIDVLHMHWGKDLILAMLAKKRHPFYLVYTRHMVITRPKKDFLHRIQYQAVDRILTITQDMEQQAVRYLPLNEEQIKCLYLGVRAPQNNVQREDFFSENSFPRRKLNIALFGRVEHNKGQHLLIDAVMSLVDQGMDISVTLVGHVMNQVYKEKLQTLISEKKLSTQIRFIDFIDEPIDSMANFDVIVLATYKETFGLVLPEAMRVGVAVIGSNAGGVPEIIDDGKTGLLFTPGDSTSLAVAIRKYYENPELRLSIAIAGKNKADQKFSDQKHFEQLKSLLVCRNHDVN